MKLLYVVQRYGPNIAGGAEQYCRQMAERMLEHGHDVEVATTSAESYVDWANVFDPGVTKVHDVTVHRFPVVAPHDNELFGPLNQRLSTGHGTRPLSVQREWMRMQGPYSPALIDWLTRHSRRYDCVVFFTYLYWPTWAGLRAVAGTVPTLLSPTVHDEPPLWLSVFDEVFHTPDAFALCTVEEIDLIKRRFHFEPEGAVVGIGVDLVASDLAPFRAAFPMDRTPYLLYVGRVDYSKGTGELVNFFVEFKQRHPSDLKLVLLGELLLDIPERDDIISTGFVDYDIRDSALAGALALAQPSYFESFSMVLTESFAHRRPTLVQGKYAVLRGHAERSGAAIPYEGFAEFEAATEALLADPALADRMGEAGRRYVEREYDWDVVMARYEAVVEATIRNSPSSKLLSGSEA